MYQYFSKSSGTSGQIYLFYAIIYLEHTASHKSLLKFKLITFLLIHFLVESDTLSSEKCLWGCVSVWVDECGGIQTMKKRHATDHVLCRHWH